MFGMVTTFIVVPGEIGNRPLMEPS